MDSLESLKIRSNKEFWSESGQATKIAWLLNNDFMSDITFVVRQKPFPAHKFVLASESEIFHAMFYGPMADDKKEIEIEDCENPDDFLQFLSLIYRRKAQVTWENVGQLLYLRKKYMIKVDEALFYRLLPVDASKLLPLLQWFVALEEEGMVEKCMEVIREKINTLVDTSQFLALDQPSLKRILQQESLDIEEIDLLKAVDKWCTHKVNSREASGERISKRDAIGDALYFIRFPTLRMREFVSYCGNSELLTDQQYRALSIAIWSKGDRVRPSPHGSHESALPASQRKRNKKFHRKFRYCDLSPSYQEQEMPDVYTGR